MGQSRVRAEGLIAEELCVFKAARAAGDNSSAWKALEQAHIISQPFLDLHVANHWTMLRYALALGDGREAVGQLVRLMLAPLGNLSGRIPIGNTGRANVNAFQPMPISQELQARLDQE